MEINAVAIALMLIVGAGCALLVSIGRTEAPNRELSRPRQSREDGEAASVRRS